MRNLLALIILISAMLTKQHDYISIEHIGISDKPIATIIISKEKIASSETENFIVSSKDYSVLKAATLSNAKGNYNGHEFGSFKITIKDIKAGDLSACLNRQRSIELLNKLIETLEKKNANVDLISRLENIRKRIVY